MRKSPTSVQIGMFPDQCEVGDMPITSRIKELGQYPTPVWVAEAIVERHFHNLDARDCVVEPSCGPGAFLAAIPQNVPAIGVEIDASVAYQARLHTSRPVLIGDFHCPMIGNHQKATCAIRNL